MKKISESKVVRESKNDEGKNNFHSICDFYFLGTEENSMI